MEMVRALVVRRGVSCFWSKDYRSQRSGGAAAGGEGLRLILRFLSRRCLFDERADIQDQYRFPVSELGRSGNPRGIAKNPADGLNDNLLLSFDRIHYQTQAFFSKTHNDHVQTGICSFSPG